MALGSVPVVRQNIMVTGTYGRGCSLHDNQEAERVPVLVDFLLFLLLFHLSPLHPQPVGGYHPHSG
jgi:hypothetical protein